MTKKKEIWDIWFSYTFLPATGKYPTVYTIGDIPGFVVTPSFSLGFAHIQKMYRCYMSDQSTRGEKYVKIEATTEKDFFILLQEAKEKAKRIGSGATISQFLGQPGEVPPCPPTHPAHRLLPYFVSPHSWESKVNLIIDYTTYHKSSPDTQRKMCLDAIHTGMLALSKKDGFDPAMLNDTYQRCLDKKMVFNFILKNKTVRSPNHRYFGTVECCWDDVLTATAVIRDRQGKEVLRQEIGREETLPEFIGYAKAPRWKGGSFGFEGKHWFELEKRLRSWYVEVYKPEPSTKKATPKQKKTGK